MSIGVEPLELTFDSDRGKDGQSRDEGAVLIVEVVGHTLRIGAVVEVLDVQVGRELHTAKLPAFVYPQIQLVEGGKIVAVVDPGDWDVAVVV